MFKKIIILMGIFSLFGMIYGETIDIGNLEVSNFSHPSYPNVISFKLNNLNGSSYMLNFTHYGNINWTITKSILLYLNGRAIYTFKKDNCGWGWDKKTTLITISKSYLKIENNELKLVPDGQIKKSTYYKLNDITMVIKTTTTTTSTTKAPIPTPAIIISILAVVLIILKNRENL
ncbi:hypothetical protein [Methanothermococcus sp.]|uniref:hypothetical protein n=1 Tax=Methanothermococcus sp. TaxID=2614238 RepID=UPI0025EC79E5|nr:hypothetical protein [Methanothermococcus sp.]